MRNKVMKANELMVGDYLMHNGFPYRVIQVDGIVRDGWMIENGEEDCGEPIPITPEILEKNGFVANKHVYPYPYYEYINKEDKLKVGFAFPQGNRTSYKDPWVYIDSERVFVEHLPCMFVHQLQHALRLCGIEKTIEL